MKKLSIFIVAIFMALGSFAQTVSDAYIKVEYVGYNREGAFEVRITNLQDSTCRPKLTINWEPLHSITAVSPGELPGGIHHVQLQSNSTLFYFWGAYNIITFYINIDHPCTLLNPPNQTLVLTTSNVVLGVTLSSVAVHENEQATAVTWTTTSEQNNKYFTVEGSIDGKAWDSLGIVKSKWGASGSGSTSQDYEFILFHNYITAGFGGIVVLLLVFGMAFKGRRLKEQIIVCGLALISIGVFSCKKDNNVDKHTKYQFFRLTQTDMDGNKTTYQVVSI